MRFDVIMSACDVMAFDGAHALTKTAKAGIENAAFVNLNMDAPLGLIKYCVKWTNRAFVIRFNGM